MTSDDPLAPAREKVALACRILARQGLVEGILGHVSVRIDERSMLIRCRGPEDIGVLHTAVSDIRLVDLDGEHLEDSPDYNVPNELPIHGELMKARPQINSVVHAHPWASVVCGIAELELRPVFGAFNIPAMRMARAGVAVFQRGCLITRPDLADQMIDAMDGSDACLLRGHGITSAGETVEASTIRALDLDTLARMTVQLHQVGATAPATISEEDVAELPDLGATFNEQRVWRHLAAGDRRE